MNVGTNSTFNVDVLIAVTVTARGVARVPRYSSGPRSVTSATEK